LKPSPARPWSVGYKCYNGDMLRIDNSLLEEIGLGGLPANEKNSFLKHIYETLEMRVGIRLADQMTNEQLDEFEKYFEAKDDAGAFKWLETNFPNYKDIVQQEFDKLREEVRQQAPQILAASQAQPAPAGTPQSAGPSADAAYPPTQTPAPAQAYAAPSPNPASQPAAYQSSPNQPQPTPQYNNYQTAVGGDPAPPPQPSPAPGPNPEPTFNPAPSPVPPSPEPPATPAPPVPPVPPAPPQPSPTPPPVQSPDQNQPAPPYQPPFPSQQPPAGPSTN
jgi:hypothetical protein